jgi:tungstate transport system substrate-binding protein
MLRQRFWLYLPVMLLLAGCASRQPQVLHLATTTSTYDSGLLDAILPDFESRYNAKVDTVAVGTGQAITLGRQGDADVILVHDRAKEDAFVADGSGTERYDVMYNDFIIVGPKEDPAHIAGMASASAALSQIAQARAPFASRGDQSGTDSKEKSLWAQAGLIPDAKSGWYFSLGQGMGDTLQFAQEKQAYTLTDRGTFLAQQQNLPDLIVLVGGETIAANPDPALRNPYGVIPVNPAKYQGINAKLATDFVSWLTSLDTQQMIGDFGKDRFGQPLFYPASAEWLEAHP